MNLPPQSLSITFILFSFFSINGFSQKSALKSAAKEIMNRASTCTLITLDASGRPIARAMETLPIKDDFIVWLGTNPQSRKVTQIKNDPRVTIYYLDKGSDGYVTLYGAAEIIIDAMEKETHWKEEWKAFYLNKKEGFVLIKITPKWMEVVSNSRGIIGDSITWETPKVVFNLK